MSAVGVEASTVSIPEAGPGAIPRTALYNLLVRPVPAVIAKQLVVREHYLHSWPGGTKLAFGVFLGHRLLGAVTLGVGPYNAHRLVAGAEPDDCLTLSRLWLSDDLPKNSESRVLGIVTRGLRKNTDLKFLVSYADPAQGHVGTIYQATGWVYTGLSDQMPMYDLGDGRIRHSRSLSHSFGTHSVRHFAKYGIQIKLVPQGAKHRYIYFLDPGMRTRLGVAGLPYPKLEVNS